VACCHAQPGRLGFRVAATQSQPGRPGGHRRAITVTKTPWPTVPWLCTCQNLQRSVGLVLQDGTRVNTAAIPALLNDSDLAYYGHHPNLKCAHSAKTIHHGPAQRHSLQWRQPALRTINMHSGPLTGPATPLLWRQPARRSTPATCRARAHAWRQQPKAYATRIHAPAASASVAPQPTSSGSAQRPSVSLTAVETMGTAQTYRCGVCVWKG
jgi:hypothetical protein